MFPSLCQYSFNWSLFWYRFFCRCFGVGFFTPLRERIWGQCWEGKGLICFFIELLSIPTHVMAGKRDTKPEALGRQSCPLFSSTLHWTFKTILHPKGFINDYLINSYLNRYNIVTISYPKNSITTWPRRVWSMTFLKGRFDSLPLYTDYINNLKIQIR